MVVIKPLNIERTVSKEELRELIKGKHLVLTYTRNDHKAYTVYFYIRLSKTE